MIEYQSFRDPEPGSKEVLLDVKAGSLNYLDIWTRRGMPSINVEMPHIPGSDAAGEIVEVGDQVSRFSEGDRVTVDAGLGCGECSFCRRGEKTLCPQFQIIGEHIRGVHSELAALQPDNLISVPDDISWEVAAAAPLVFQTAWRMLTTKGKVKPGEDVLVLGASGGVGHAAVQIASHMGATVYATAGTDDKCAAVSELGADHTVNYEKVDFSEKIRSLTGGRGVDVVIDHIGSDTWSNSLQSLVKGGRILTCGATTGPNPDANLNRVFWNQLQVIGSTMANPGEVEDVLELVWEGEVEPAIQEVIPMSQTPRAHELLENREGVGKVVVVPDSEHQ